MRLAAAALAAGLCASPAGAAPFENFFDYEAPRLPAAGDCDAIAAERGEEETWHGEFTGNRYELFLEEYFPFGVQGCFTSEFACEIFLQRAITYADGGQILVARCRRGRG